MGCYDSRPVSSIVTVRHYYCGKCKLSFQSIETLDKDGVPKRSYKKSGKYKGKYKPEGGRL